MKKLSFLDSFELPFHEAGWTGAWPPPVEFFVFTGKQTGIVKIWPADDKPTASVREAAEHPSIRAEVFRRRTATITGAEYVYERPFSI